MSGIASLAFGLGMSAFNGSLAASLCISLLWVSALPDFPSVIVRYLTFRLRTGYFPSSGIAEIYGAVLAPSVWMFGWSLCFGVIVFDAEKFNNGLKKGGYRKKQMDLIRSWFVQEKARWEKNSQQPQ